MEVEDLTDRLGLKSEENIGEIHTEPENGVDTGEAVRREEAAVAGSTDTTDQSGGTERAADAGPRKNRLNLFNKVMEKSLQRLIADASFQRFAKTFHPFYKQKPQVTESIHKQFVSQLQISIKEDIAQIMEEGNLQAKLQELDRLEAASQDSAEPAWRPSGVPEEDFGGFVAPYYLQQREYLRKELKKLQRENASLAQSVLAGREAVARTEQHIARSLEEWQDSQKALQKLTSMF
ncbi:polyamine-modulated factor 1 [Amia ocellicauda]|uniref:polyamine-modulated factor 1 n=1 Tax=Amia ocellicauda TaxID=2972642 RepID=UPI00346449F1